jgi:hypothetical protein
MGIAEFIKSRFLGGTLCVYLGESAETITYDQAWAANKEFFKGIVQEVEDGVLCLEVEGVGVLYINCEQIQSVWQPPFDYHQAVSTSLTRRLAGARRKDR